MPFGDLIGEIAHRIFIQILGEFIEIPIRALGYAIVKYIFYFGQRKVDRDGHAVLIAGVLGWIAVAIVIYKIW